MGMDEDFEAAPLGPIFLTQQLPLNWKFCTISLYFLNIQINICFLRGQTFLLDI